MAETTTAPTAETARQLSREELLDVMKLSGCAAGTVRNYLRGRARGASVKRIEDALTTIRAQQATTPAGVR